MNLEVRKVPMFRKAFPARITLAGMLLSGCLTGGDGRQKAQPTSSKPFSTSVYVVQGDRIIFSGFADTSYSCNGDTLVPYIDAYLGDTTPFNISGTTLTLVSSTDTSQSGAVVDQILLLTETGGPGGLEGTWRDQKRDYRVVAGTLTADEKAVFEAQLTRLRFDDSFDEIEYVFDSGFIRIYKDVKTAERARARWTGKDPALNYQADSLKYDMDAFIVDKYTVEYRGRRTLDRVRVIQMPNGDIDVVSMTSADPPFQRPKNPTVCPREDVPAWYSEFFSKNQKNPVP